MRAGFTYPGRATEWPFGHFMVYVLFSEYVEGCGVACWTELSKC